MSTTRVARQNAAVLTADRTIELRVRDVPEIGARDVLVRVAATGVCGSDLSTWRGLHPYKRPPVVLGHELCGTVVRRGAAVVGIEVGDRVVAAAYSPCGTCAACARGATNLCVARANLSHGEWDGSFAEHVRLRDNMTFVVDPALDVEAAAMAEPLSIARHAVRMAGPAAGRSVAVLGCGGIGLCCALVARAVGFASVVGVDRGAGKAAVVARAGVDHYVDAADQDVVAAVRDRTGGGADVTVVAAGYPGVLDQAGAITRPGGVVVVVSYFDRPHELSPQPFVSGELTVRFSALSTAADFADVIGWLQSGAVDPRPVVTHRFPISGAAAAVATLDSGRSDVGKIMLLADGPSGAPTGNPT